MYSVSQIHILFDKMLNVTNGPLVDWLSRMLRCCTISFAWLNAIACLHLCNVLMLQTPPLAGLIVTYVTMLYDIVCMAQCYSMPSSMPCINVTNAAPYWIDCHVCYYVVRYRLHGSVL